MIIKTNSHIYKHHIVLKVDWQLDIGLKSQDSSRVDPRNGGEGGAGTEKEEFRSNSS